MKRADLLATLDIGAAVKKLREIKGISQEELAKDICDRTNITKLENGYSKIPSLSFILLICDKLEISIEEFLNFAMNNSYSLNRKQILEFLLKEDLYSLKKYLSNIDASLLSNNDSSYYKYLISKVYIFENKNDEAKTLLLDIIKNNHNHLLTALSYHELIKNQYIELTESFINDFYSYNELTKLTTHTRSNEGIYLLNDLITKSINENKDIDKINKLLDLEFQFIENHECYKYLSYYYENKINTNKSYISNIDFNFKDRANKKTLK